MRDGRATSFRILICALAVCLAAGLLPAHAGLKKGDKRALQFASEMARAGSWREAEYRWADVLRRHPENGRLHGNLAVAAEALGRWDDAEAAYGKALELEPDNLHLEENYRRFSVFREKLRRYEADGELPPDDRRVPTFGSGEAKRKGKVFQVTVGLPMPPRLKLNGDETILVVSFLDDETTFLDINKEMIRYLRGAFSSRTAFDVLDVPAPPIPEQTPEDLLANREFWKYLHREYGADLIVSGELSYDREDYSGYQEVDVVSPVTGQKVRQTRFVEQEKFSYYVQVFFIDGESGEPLYRDRLQRSAVIRGSMNDPITTFFEMSDTIASEVLAIVTTRVRAESRAVFKQ